MEFLSSRGSQLSVPTYVKQFGLFLDNDPALRCKGRLSNSSLDLGSRNPILLPSRERFVELLIREVHERVKHNGTRDALTTIRERFWIIRGREAVKKVVKKCVMCCKAKGVPYETAAPPDLPASRVSENPPFTNVGLDFAGPLYVRESRGNTSKDSSKVYVLIIHVRVNTSCTFGTYPIGRCTVVSQGLQKICKSKGFTSSYFFRQREDIQSII